MKHFICTGGCGGSSDKPGVCQTPHCLKHNKPLVECGCNDGRHQPLMKVCEHCGKLCQGNCEVEPYKEELS